MDWPKAKNVLIVALLATNLFLIWAIFSSKEVVPVNTELIDQTISILEENGIHVYCDVPEKNRKAAVLSVLYDESNGTFTYELEDQTLTDALTEETAVEIAEDFLISHALYTENTVLFSSTMDGEESYRVSFKNVVDGIEIEDCYTICTVTEQGVSKMERNWLNPSGYGKNKREIIPVTTILMTFMTEKLNQENKSSITDISLVYKLDSPYGSENDTSSDTAFPMWRITCSDGTKTYYNAYEI